MKRVLGVTVLVAAVLFAAWGSYRAYRPRAAMAPAEITEVRTVQMKGQTVRVAVADTESTRRQGLSGRPYLAEGEGMLFVFSEDDEHAFWMKDMLFSIDIVWLSGDGKVVHVVENVSPDTYPRTFRSDVPARYVLELPAGYVKARGVRIGDVVRL